MKIPEIFADYLESYEMDATAMSNEQLLIEAEYCRDPRNGFVNPVDECGRKVYDDDEYTPQQIAALTRFIKKLRNSVGKY